MIYDAIVVGAGPSGSTAARELAERGATVLLLDKARFPRDKPCGGGVTIRAAELLPFDLAPVVERIVDGVHLSLKMQGGFTRRYGAPITYLTQRRHLDAYLAGQAEARGVAFRDGEAVEDLEESASSVRVRTRAGAYAGRVVIGADGVNGMVARLAGLTGRRDIAVALEANSPVGDRYPERWRTTVGMDLGGIPGGYGWLFPKGDHLNVGVGGWHYLADTLRGRLHELCAFYGIDAATLNGLRGYQLPVRRRGAPLARGRIALVGDAAGAIDPLSGEGIYGAMFTGKQAARTAAQMLSRGTVSFGAYVRHIERELTPDLEASRRFQDVFYLVPGLYVALLERSDRIWQLLARLIRGEQTYIGFKRRLGMLGLAVDLLSCAVRATPLRRAAGLPH